MPTNFKNVIDNENGFDNVVASIREDDNIANLHGKSVTLDQANFRDFDIFSDFYVYVQNSTKLEK